VYIQSFGVNCLRGEPAGWDNKSLWPNDFQRCPAAAPYSPVAFVQVTKMNRIRLEGVLGVAQVAAWATLFRIGQCGVAPEVV